MAKLLLAHLLSLSQQELPFSLLPLWAQEQEEDDPGELARESIELMMKSLGLIIDAIPQYEMPIINDDGDIIIRRKQKDDWQDHEDAPEKEDDEDSKEI